MSLSLVVTRLPLELPLGSFAVLGANTTEFDVQLESGQPVIDTVFNENTAEFDKNAAEFDENAAELDKPAAARCPVGTDCASLTHACAF